MSFSSKKVNTETNQKERQTKTKNIYVMIFFLDPKKETLKQINKTNKNSKTFTNLSSTHRNRHKDAYNDNDNNEK